LLGTFIIDKKKRILSTIIFQVEVFAVPVFFTRRPSTTCGTTPCTRRYQQVLVYDAAAKPWAPTSIPMQFR